MIREYIIKISDEIIEEEIADRPQELVRCKDCRYWTSEKILEYHICKRWEKTGIKNFATAWNWFCADGERKEGR